LDIEIRSLLRSEGETRSFGRHLGSLLRPGDWVAVRGDLGAGKTTLVSGVVEAIHPGMKGRSPTYVLVEVYGAAPSIVHADLYRLGAEHEYPGLGLEDLAERDAVVLIEWPERAGERLPGERLDLELRFLDGPGREIRIRPRGARWEALAREGALDRDRWGHALYPGN
jgi:tRNA threonylcarbamoyl adenosine modification protein YjeE